MNWVATGAILMAAAVGLGAFGAHGLRDRLDAYSLSVYEKAVFYHFIHAIGILVVALLTRMNFISPRTQELTAWLLFIGILLFSGSLYVLAISGVRLLGAITPLGGICFIAAWLTLAFYALRGRAL